MLSADTVENIFSKIGFGPWQIPALAATLLLHASAPVLQLGSSLLSPPVPFHCSYIHIHSDLPSTTNSTNINIRDGDINFPYNNYTEEELDFPSRCLPGTKNQPSSLKIHDVEVNNTNLNRHATGMASCPLIEYDTSIYESTVTTEWDLVCENSSYRPLFHMAYGTGAFIACLFCGQLSDRVGRKRAIQIGAILCASMVIGTSISPWYWTTVSMKILASMGFVAALLPIYTLVAEVSPASHRTVTAMLPALVAFTFMIVFGVIAYYIRHWRKIFLLCSWSLLFLIPFTFIMDESPRWLLQNGRTSEATKILQKAALKNKSIFASSNLELPSNFDEVKKDSGLEETRDRSEGYIEKQSTFRMLTFCLTSRGMRVILLVTPIIWFLKKVLYVGIAINANNFSSSSPFQYVAFSGAMGVAGILLSIPLSRKLSRRVFLAGALATCGLLQLLELIVTEEYWYIKWAMAMTSFCLVCGVHQVNYVYSAELFPTAVRTQGLTFTNLIGSVGEMASSLVTDIAVQHHWWASSITFGLAGVVGACLLPLLPETKDNRMPETLEDVENRYWNDYRGLAEVTTSTKDTIYRHVSSCDYDVTAGDSENEQSTQRYKQEENNPYCTSVVYPQSLD